MDYGTLFLLIAIGLVAGFVSGFMGIGGGIVVIPALVYILGMNQGTAQGTTLAMMIPPIGLLAAINYYKAGQMNIKYAMILAAAFILSSYFGSKIAVNLPEATLKKIFAVLLFLVSLKIFFGK